MAISEEFQLAPALSVPVPSRNRRGRFSDRLFYHLFRTGVTTALSAVLVLVLAIYVAYLHGDIQTAGNQSIESLAIRLAITLIFLVPLTSFASWLSGRSLSALLTNLAQVAIRIGDGDWTQRAPMQGPVEIRTLAYRLNATAELMQGLLDTITHGSAQVKVATDQQIETATQTSKRAAELARSAASIDDDAAQVSILVASAEADLDRAQEAFNAYVEDSHTRDQRMNQVEDILGLINGIAKQTELLSLNAALEAERAGPAGRGLSAIAEEIRLMAEDSKTKAGDVANVIAEAQTHFAEVDASQQLASQRLAVSLESLRKVAEARARMQAATSAQVTASREVSYDMTRITYGSHKIAETTEAISATRLFLHRERRK